ncbi:MAG TPA: glycosyl hydrolase family 8 [Stellaceae bacterium]|nr:glycosyl hydrolase family 8 [Stellaceae bacterium]
MTFSPIFAAARVLAAAVLTVAGATVASAGSAANQPGALAVHAEAIPNIPMRRTGTIAASDWAIFKDRFIRENGKLVDSFSALSHSEGQGYAMLLALGANDRATFDKVWNWTRTNLKRPTDSLLAWNWTPTLGGPGGAVADSNDATDGDILVAWALHRAARQWQTPAYDAAAKPIAQDVLDKLVRDVGGFAVLLPGLNGFEHDGAITINLSYWIFPAFMSLNEIVPSLRWYELERSGLYLVSAARFGAMKLPADWMVVKPNGNGGLDLALLADKPNYGFDAMRIPLYLLWDGKASADNLASLLLFWKNCKDNKIPATVNLVSGTASAYQIPPGMRAVVAAVETHATQPDLRVSAALIPALPALADDKDYYSAALGLLVRLALSETS